jgi:hypothetical protein
VQEKDMMVVIEQVVLHSSTFLKHLELTLTELCFF